MKIYKDHQWQKVSQIVTVNTPWLKLFCEQYTDYSDRLMNYWRVEKENSAIAITLQGDKIIMPKPIFRPGVQKETLDFPGGRVPPEINPKKEIKNILKRELNIHSEDILEIIQINEKGWSINSFFSSQLLYGFIVRISPTANFNNSGTVYYPVSKEGISRLLTKIDCLQCRAIFLEYLLNYSILRNGCVSYKDGLSR